jgi:hypothetical protein
VPTDASKALVSVTNTGTGSNVLAASPTLTGTAGFANITASGTLNVTGVTTVQAGTALLPAITTTGDTNTGIFFPAADTIAFAEGGVESMRIDSSGNVGIGTSSPAVKLHVYSTASDGANMRLQSTGGSIVAKMINNDNGYKAWVGNDGTNDQWAVGQWNLTGANLGFYTGSGLTERMRIDSSGNLQFNSGYGSVAIAYGCRAWVNFNGTGTVAIRASGNVTSITDNGVGDYTVNFTTAMPDANYSAVAMGQEVAGPSLVVMYIHRTSPYATGSVRLAAINSSTGGVADTAFVNVAILR